MNPFESDLPEGTVIRAVDAVDWSVGRHNCDIRPRLLDKSTGISRLVDSGSQISVTQKLPGDTIDKSLKLVAVNGSKIETYGVREIEVKIGRKSYKMPAVVCDVKQDILGMDFIAKFKLNFEWDEFDQSELYIVDRKAQIKAQLQVITVPVDTPRVNYLSKSDSAEPSQSALNPPPSAKVGVPRINNEEVEFQVACMKRLQSQSQFIGQNDKSASQNNKIEDQLKMHDDEYVQMIKAHPQLLTPSFKKGEPTHGVYHKIETSNHTPCKTKRRPIVLDSEKARKGKEAWDKMIEDGVVEEVKAGTNTEWSSALHLVPKPGPGGGVRPCSDFRALNAKTVTDAHPLPLLKDFTSKIHGAKLFSVVDLRSAFFNVPIWPPHRHKTLTLSPWGGSYIYNRLAFGLSSAPSTWQKLLEHTLRGVDCFIYLDDVLCWGRNKQEHDQNLQKIFKKLAEADMALSLDKCKFGKRQVDYLGYSVTSSGIKPLERKLDCLKKFKEPESQKDVLHFCGAINYFRPSLKGIKLSSGRVKSAAEVLQPLYAIGTEKMLKKKDFKTIWENSTNLQEAFREAKSMLEEAVELAHPNSNFPLALFTDASDHSIGGSLQMLTPEGHFKPLGFYSAHLNETQRKYSVFKKELLGAFKSLRHFLPDVYGKHVTIYTDHLPLQMAFQSPSDKIPLNDPQVYRQLTEIGRFTRDIKHVSGVDNVFADYLSRIKPDARGTTYLDDADEADNEQQVAATESVKFQLLSVQLLAELQQKCPEIKLIKSGDKPKNSKFSEVEIDGAKLYCEISSDNGPRPYVPEPLRSQLIQSLHFDHLGQKSTLKRVSSQYYWPSLKRDVTLFVKICKYFPFLLFLLSSYSFNATLIKSVL